jgi:pyruvate-formate lyase-activating enzyme
MTGNARILKHWGTFVQPLLQWKSNKYYIFWVYVCSLRYPGCNLQAPHCHLWPVQWYYIFPYYLITARFSKKSYWTLNEFWFSLQLLSETFLMIRKLTALHKESTLCPKQMSSSYVTGQAAVSTAQWELKRGLCVSVHFPNVSNT